MKSITFIGNRSDIFEQIERERERQKKRYSLQHDETHSRDKWVAILTRYLGRLAWTGEIGQARRVLVVIAALCVAAIEAINRQTGEEPGNGPDEITSLQKIVADQASRIHKLGSLVERFKAATLLPDGANEVTPERLEAYILDLRESCARAAKHALRLESAIGAIRARTAMIAMAERHKFQRRIRQLYDVAFRNVVGVAKLKREVREKNEALQHSSEKITALSREISRLHRELSAAHNANRTMRQWLPPMAVLTRFRGGVIVGPEASK